MYTLKVTAIQYSGEVGAYIVLQLQTYLLSGDFLHISPLTLGPN
jgi:hypothetical protein